jgi:hypothetical protein
MLAVVHHLPILTTLIAVAFLVALARRAAPRGWPPHLAWWGIGVFFYGMGTFLESWITLGGNTLALNRAWYWAGAILGGYPLATGSVYLLLPARRAHVLTAASMVLVVFASACVFLTPLDAAKLEPERPTGAILEWQWVRLLTPFINGYAALFLVGGAIWSCVQFLRRGDQPRRAAGTALIALGGLLPGIGGSMAKAGIVEALYVGELVGLVLIWWGYELCIRSPASIDRSRAVGRADPAEAARVRPAT